jgi:AraC-like DNA-binding protein
METFFKIVAGAGFIQGLFMAATIASRKRARDGGGARRELARERPADLVLALLMLAFSANILHAGFLRDWRSLGATSPVPDSYEPFTLLFGPLAFLFVRIMSGTATRDRRLGIADLRHFLPAFALVLGVPALAHLLPSSSLRALDIGFWACSILYLLAYLLATGRIIHAHRRRLREEYSAIEAVDLGWVQGFLISFLAVELLSLALLVGMVHADPFPHFGKALALASTLLAYALGYHGLTRRAPSEAVEGRPPEAVGPAASAEAARDELAKYARSGLKAHDAKDIEAELVRCMADDKPWLEPEFSLQDLSDRLGRPRNRLSQVINASFGMNFYDYVNGYRVREVQRLMSEPAFDRYKILSIALDAGFASKNTFNAVFKKIVGLTPSRYRSSLGRAGPEE